MLQDAIRVYHDLLTDELAAESQGWLDRQQQLHGLFFGTRPMCSVLRPRFLSTGQFRFLQSRVKLLLRAFHKIERAALDNAAFRRQFGLTDWEEQLAQIDPGFACSYPTSRLDSFFVSEDQLRFTEYNSETPAGAAYNDALTELFYGLPAMRAFSDRYHVLPLPARPGIAASLLDSFHQWSGRRDLPSIAILDWREVPTYSEFVLFNEYFKSLGIPSIIADPREVEFRGGKLWAGSNHITLVYKRVLISELVERGGMDHPVIRAVRDGAVCMVNPFRCKILYKKASLAVLTDERNAQLLTPDERTVVSAHVPWTRRMEQRQTEPPGGGSPVDLVPYVLKHRERLVLKPNDDYGGKGIVLGWTVDDSGWERAVQVALADPYVVQERVVLPREPFPSLVDGRVAIIDRMLDTNPFVSDGKHMDACLTRISTADLLNVTAGGGSTVPTFLVEPR